MVANFLQSISWKRGLWRLWIVASVLWVVLAFFIAAPLNTIEHRADPIRVYIGADTVEFPYDTPKSTMHAALVKLVKQEVATSKKDPSAPWEQFQPARDPESEAVEALEFYSPPHSVADVIFAWMKLTLIPPLIMLGIAYIIGWIIRGFSPSAGLP